MLSRGTGHLKSPRLRTAQTGDLPENTAEDLRACVGSDEQARVHSLAAQRQLNCIGPLNIMHYN